jgi:hypothetical protein
MPGARLDRGWGGVAAAVERLGDGLVKHRGNRRLRAQLRRGELSPATYCRHLIGLVYRLSFVLVAEARGGLPARGAEAGAAARYASEYSVGRLAVLSGREGREAGDERDARDAAEDRGELWEGLRRVLSGLHAGCPELALPAVGTALFSDAFVPWLGEVSLSDRALLGAIRALCFVERGGGVERVRWQDVGADVLAGAYESALELVPTFVPAGPRFSLAAQQGEGHDRRSKGSYYTPAALVERLLDSALEPVVAAACEGRPREEQATALLALRVCDPACGAGYFLVAAARRLGRRLAALRTPGAAPGAGEVDAAVREVVTCCLRGVDSDPIAVELCKLALWMEALGPGMPPLALEDHIRVGNSLIGATPRLLEGGIPDAAFLPLEGDGPLCAELRRQNTEERAAARVAGAEQGAHGGAPIGEAEVLAADAWCAAFFMPRRGSAGAGPLTHGAWVALQRSAQRGRDAKGRAGQHRERSALRGHVARISREQRFFHWHLAFPDVFAAGPPEGRSAEAGWGGGFDVVIGNPPWIAHAGRAAQPLPGPVAAFHAFVNPAFAGYRSTHGMFVYRCATLVRRGGRLGLVVPTSLADLDGYAPARAAHELACSVVEPLHDFGDGAFEGVFQPCMALVSTGTSKPGTSRPRGAVWELERPDLGAEERALLGRLRALPVLPRGLFGERGLQTSRETRALLRKQPGPDAVFSAPIREGTDVREWQLLPPRLWFSPDALAGVARGASAFAESGIVIRQTARFPIAARNDGSAFRNSLLAGFPEAPWTAGVLLCLLNSRLVRWFHYQNFRDARQGMPQVKVAHLRSIPRPTCLTEPLAAELDALGLRLAGRNTGVEAAERAGLERLVLDAYGVSAAEAGVLAAWTVPR